MLLGAMLLAMPSLAGDPITIDASVQILDADEWENAAIRFGLYTQHGKTKLTFLGQAPLGSGNQAFTRNPHPHDGDIKPETFGRLGVETPDWFSVEWDQKLVNKWSLLTYFESRNGIQSYGTGFKYSIK